ncbi:MAG: hypothetical protein AAF519_19545, partial [Bacteroidota bacterium]
MEIIRYNIKSLVGILAAIISLVSCGKQGPTEDEFASAAENYADIVLANYQDSYDETVKLK